MNQAWETTLLHEKWRVKASRMESQTLEGFCNCSQTPRKGLGIPRGLRWCHCQWARGIFPPVPAWTETGGWGNGDLDGPRFTNYGPPRLPLTSDLPKTVGEWTLLVAPHGQHWAPCVWVIFSPGTTGWMAENWCFRIVVLEKTLESPLDSEEIKPVHPKGNQPWIFIGRTNTETEAPILWPPDGNNWLIVKEPNAGKIEGKRRRGWQRMRWLVSLTQWTWVWKNSGR